VRPDHAELIPETDAPAGLYLPLMLFETPARVEIGLDVEVSEPTTLRVRWLAPNGYEWTSERSVAHRFDAGRSRATLAIAAPAIAGALQLQVDAGSARIHLLEVTDLAASGSSGSLAPAEAALDPETVDQLRALGYAE
jgi:hypothetical protein